VLGGELVGGVHASVAVEAQGSVVLAAHDDGLTSVTHITEDLHGATRAWNEVPGREEHKQGQAQDGRWLETRDTHRKRAQKSGGR
jgi:hypothetical protein